MIYLNHYLHGFTEKDIISYDMNKAMKFKFDIQKGIINHDDYESPEHHSSFTNDEEFTFLY